MELWHYPAGLWEEQHSSHHKYNGFCTVPSHINYQKEVAGFYNLYEPITHIPVEGDFKHIRSLVEHILVSSMSWEWTIFNCYT